MEISVFLGEKTIKCQKDSNFFELKNKLLKSKGITVKYIYFKEHIINGYLLILDYPSFEVMVDPNSFKEYKTNKFRCSSCRKYFKKSKWLCSHTPKCRAKFLFNGNYLRTLKGGYIPQRDEEVIDNILGKYDKFKENRRTKMLNKINEILDFN